jgi:hypothetical protein
MVGQFVSNWRSKDSSLKGMIGRMGQLKEIANTKDVVAKTPE